MDVRQDGKAILVMIVSMSVAYPDKAYLSNPLPAQL